MFPLQTKLLLRGDERTRRHLKIACTIIYVLAVAYTTYSTIATVWPQVVDKSTIDSHRYTTFQISERSTYHPGIITLNKTLVLISFLDVTK